MRVAHAPGMPGTFSPPTPSKETAGERSRHASRHVCDRTCRDACRDRWPEVAGKRSLHSRRMRNPQFYVSGKRPVESVSHVFNKHAADSMIFIKTQESSECIVISYPLMLVLPFMKSHQRDAVPDSKVHGANMGPIWCRKGPGGPHVGPMNFAIWGVAVYIEPHYDIIEVYCIWTREQNVLNHMFNIPVGCYHLSYCW